MKKKLLIFLMASMLLIQPTNTFASTIGDEITAIDSIKTSYSEESPCQLTGYFIIPDGFGLSAYVEVMGEDGTTYKITATDENSYSEIAYVPYGKYIVTNYGIVDDVANKYPMTLTSEEEFELSKDNDFKTIKLKLDSFNEVSQEIATQKGEGVVAEQLPADEMELEKKKEDVLKIGEEIVFPTFFKNVFCDTMGTMYYKTENTSKNGDLYITGNAVNDYNIHIEIIEPGVLEESQFSISLDGGQSFIGTDFVSEECSVNGTGLKFHFSLEEGKIFEKGETFNCKIVNSQVVTGNTEEANVIASGLSNVEKKYKINFLTEGKCGTAKFEIIKDDIKSQKKIAVIPEDGLYKYDGMTFYFSDGEYTTNTSFSVTCREFKSGEINYTPIIVLGGILLVLGVIIYLFLSSKKENENEYCLKIWDEMQDKDNYK